MGNKQHVYEEQPVYNQSLCYFGYRYKMEEKNAINICPLLNVGYSISVHRTGGIPCFVCTTQEQLSEGLAISVLSRCYLTPCMYRRNAHLQFIPSPMLPPSPPPHTA